MRELIVSRYFFPIYLSLYALTYWKEVTFMTKDDGESKASDKNDENEPQKKGEESSGSCGCGCGGPIGSK